MTEQQRNAFHLFNWVILASIFWFVVLPWIATWESVERHLQLLDERHINASAMFYTELEDR